jgi:hypothetical protein
VVADATVPYDCAAFELEVAKIAKFELGSGRRLALRHRAGDSGEKNECGEFHEKLVLPFNLFVKSWHGSERFQFFERVRPILDLFLTRALQKPMRKNLQCPAGTASVTRHSRPGPHWAGTLSWVAFIASR